MARTKQATPLRRETSSEYFSKNDALKRTVSGESPKPSNGVTTKEVPPAVASPPPKQEPAAAFQVLVATGGIYMSLYVMSSWLHDHVREGLIANMCPKA